MAALLPWINFFMASVALAFSTIALITAGFRPPWLIVETFARRVAEFSSQRAQSARKTVEPFLRPVPREQPIVVVEAPAPVLELLDRPRAPGSIRRVDRAEPSAVAGPRLIAVPNLAVSAPVEESASLELRRRFGAIWDFADQGMAEDEIARQSGYPIGQVELILGLRRQLILAGSLAESRAGGS